MELEDKRTILPVVATAIVAVGIAGWYFIGGSPSGEEAGPVPEVGDVGAATALLELNARLKFSPIVPAAAAPTPPERVFVSENDPRVALNSFRIVGENGFFTPSTIVVGAGENVQVSFTAVDRDYDMAVAAPIGAYVVARKGETQYFGFSMDQEGTYTFMCYRHCPDGGGVSGSIVVVKKNS